MKAKLQRAFKILLLTVVLAILGWGSYSVVRYARTAPRFEVKQLSVSGLKHVGENEVLGNANFEIGSNVFTVDLNELRDRVEKIQWVRYALVERVLPDQILIKVIEREPIGLARIRGSIYQFDADGVLLEPDSTTSASFPVLDGMRGNDPRGNQTKVEIYRKVVEELGSTELSEIHINDNGEAAVVSSSDPLTVSLGVTDFHNRWIKYLQLKTQIQQQYPDAERVDLRFRNQVIVRMKNDDEGEQVIWDNEKKSL